MTAICGIWRLDGQGSAADDCERMRRTLAIYGRDRSASWDGGDIALGIQLARLVPEDVHDRQPLTGGGGRFVMVADARIDNRPELAVELGIDDERLRTMADSDVVLAAWERWGEGALERLYGDYALAVWDADRRTLTLARDPLGQRPLFYHQGEGFCAFATMAKGLHALPEMPVSPDLETLRDYLALAPMRGPRSFFAQINRVEPGAVVILHADGRAESREWYEWRLDRQLILESDEAYVEAFRAVFDRAVADRLRATGSVGSHLSGGLDSSAVTTTAAMMLAPYARRLSAYTHVPMQGVVLDEMPDRISDEGPLAARVAATQANIDHVLIEAPDRQIGDDLDVHFHASEYPALNLCNQVWITEIAHRAAARGDRVLLVGMLGNMTISNSGEERLSELFWNGRFVEWVRETRAAVRAGHSWLGAWIGRPLVPLLPAPLSLALRKLRGEAPWELPDYSALRADVLRSAEFHRRIKALRYDPTFGPWPDVRSRQVFALRRYDILGHMQKGNLAAFGIDQRDPTADRRLVELCLSLPLSMFQRDGLSKWLYHRAFAERVPSDVRNELRKGYQAADWLVRLRRNQPILRDVLREAADSPQVSGLIDTKRLAEIIGSAPPTGPVTARARMDYRYKLLRGLSVAHFIRRLDRSNRPSPVGDREDPEAART